MTSGAPLATDARRRLIEHISDEAVFHGEATRSAASVKVTF